MDLILWRHAEAEEGSPDASRRLTGKGKRQAALMARWLKVYLPKHARLLASPACRAQQTMQALDLPFETLDDLAQGNEAQQILEAINWPNDTRPVVIVGHNPAFGQIGALLLSGEAQDWNLKKGGVWWFTRFGPEDFEETILQAAMTPGLLKRVRQKGRTV